MHIASSAGRSARFAIQNTLFSAMAGQPLEDPAQSVARGYTEWVKVRVCASEVTNSTSLKLKKRSLRDWRLPMRGSCLELGGQF